MELAESGGIVKAGGKAASIIRRSWRAAQAGASDCMGGVPKEVYYCDSTPFWCSGGSTYSCVGGFDAVCSPGTSDNIFDCDRFDCLGGFDCTAVADFSCTVRHVCSGGSGETFECETGHIFWCNDDHDCWSSFVCNSLGNVPCNQPPFIGYAYGDPGDFVCEDTEGSVEAFDCHDDFDCNAASRFECYDHFDCNGDEDPDGHFYCDKPPGAGFDCHAGANFDCDENNNYTYCGQ